MSQDLYDISDSQQNQVITSEQFSQVIDAIIEGKYSWACVLILRFAQYNPLHYIPARTYNRLMKEHLHSFNGRVSSTKNLNSPTASTLNKKPTKVLQDLDYLEEINTSSTQITGGHRVIWVGTP